MVEEALSIEEIDKMLDWVWGDYEAAEPAEGSNHLRSVARRPARSA